MQSKSAGLAQAKKVTACGWSATNLKLGEQRLQDPQRRQELEAAVTLYLRAGTPLSHASKKADIC